MSESDTLWRRDGRNVEDLPDPFGLETQELGQPGETQASPTPKRRRYWKYGLYAFAGLLLATLIWLIVTAPLSRALEPLDDPAMLLLSAEGKPIARRGAIKDKPVAVPDLDPLTPAAFIAIEDRRFRRHW